MSEERLEQVREIDGELAYEKMRRAVEKASQVERARQVERSSKLPARKRPERRGPERGGPERDIVSRQNCADNCNSSPLTMTPTSNHSGGGALQRLLKERQREERVRQPEDYFDMSDMGTVTRDEAKACGPRLDPAPHYDLVRAEIADQRGTGEIRLGVIMEELYCPVCWRPARGMLADTPLLVSLGSRLVKSVEVELVHWIPRDGICAECRKELMAYGACQFHRGNEE